MPFSVNVPIFGNVSTLPEVLNLHDNFAAGELRDHHVERVIAAHERPVIVDCGVNVGITVRWWFHLNPKAKVVGIDMIAEAHAFTIQKLQSQDYVPITAALSKKGGEDASVRFDDPLNGESSLARAAGSIERSVPTTTLDELLRPLRLSEVTLLKIDIEGAAVEAIQAASNTLAITRHIVFEHHSTEELGIVTRELVKAGFLLRRFKNRNLWFVRA